MRKNSFAKGNKIDRNSSGTVCDYILDFLHPTNIYSWQTGVRDKVKEKLTMKQECERNRNESKKKRWKIFNKKYLNARTKAISIEAGLHACDFANSQRSPLKKSLKYCMSHLEMQL
jgi:hypothetical protein